MAVAILGLVYIAAYGSWYYAFGVLFDPIWPTPDGGNRPWPPPSRSVWSPTGSLDGGRPGPRPPATAVFPSAVWQRRGPVVVGTPNRSPSPGSAVAMSLLGGFGFYRVTMTCAVRLHPDRSAGAIAVLTSGEPSPRPSCRPAASRPVRLAVTIRILAVVVAAVFVLAAPSSADRAPTSPADARYGDRAGRSGPSPWPGPRLGGHVDHPRLPGR